MLEKFCGRCKQTRSVAEFAKNRVKKDGLQERCTPCREEHYRKHQPAIRARAKQRHNPAKRRDERLRDKYNISSACYERLLQEQGGVCAICKKPNSGKGRPWLVVDHCHTTNAVRGLLCDLCNRAIGLMQDSPTILSSALIYLERSTSGRD